MIDTDHIKPLTPGVERRIANNPLLNIDTFIIPSPYVRDPDARKDYEHSSIWEVEGEILGFLLVYSDRKLNHYHIYKLGTSPFGRGRGIGTAFIETLAERVPDGSVIYLYIWEKQADTIDFFKNKGFQVGDPLVYRNLIYYYIHAEKEMILEQFRLAEGSVTPSSEEIGRTRHDARKTLRLLSHMVDMLSIDNCSKMVEDINRETTSLINMLNAFRDSMEVLHEVNLRDLVLERIVPYIEASSVPCKTRINLDAESPVILGYYVNIGRALINLVSNALDAIEEAGRKGVLTIGISEGGGDTIYFTLRDNGIGINPAMLRKEEGGLPAFVGRTTKGHKTGEGLGTQQIYTTFGAENIEVESDPGKGTRWCIRMEKSSQSVDKLHVRMKRRFSEFKDLWETWTLTPDTERTKVIAFIWQLRKMEIFLFDLIMQFSTHHNIRSIYRSFLSYFHGFLTRDKLEETVAGYRCDWDVMKAWLLETADAIRSRSERLRESVAREEYQGAFFKSYGQAWDNVIIFTLDPENGDFLATDRKLAEHLDFVPYLGKERDQLLRGEFKGDLNRDNQPVFLGVWSVGSREDLIEKLKLIRRGVATLLTMGLHPEKRLSFYQTTYVRGEHDIDSDRMTTLGAFSGLADSELDGYIRRAEDEMQDFIFAAE